MAADIDRLLSDLQTGAIDSTLPAVPADGHKVTLIADPPSTGLSEAMRHTILALAPGAFFYVSCNPATLARDLNAMQERFTVESVTPLDMFPQTAEIEVAVHLQAR